MSFSEQLVQRSQENSQPTKIKQNTAFDNYSFFDRVCFSYGKIIRPKSYSKDRACESVREDRGLNILQYHSVNKEFITCHS